MRRRLLVLVVALLAVPLGAQSPAPALQVPYRQFTLANGLNVILHQDNSVPVVVGERLVPRRLGQREAGPHRLRAPVRAPDVRGLEAREGRRVRHAARRRRRQQQRLDHQRPHQLLIDVPSNALELALFLESDRMGYLLDTMTPERVDGQRDVVKNERRQSYENRPYGMASTRARQDAVAGRASLQLADDRLHGGPDRRQPRGRRRVLQEVLRAEQRQPGDRRRHRLRPDARAGREVVRRDSARRRRSSRSRRRPRS